MARAFKEEIVSNLRELSWSDFSLKTVLVIATLGHGLLDCFLTSSLDCTQNYFMS